MTDDIMPVDDKVDRFSPDVFTPPGPVARAFLHSRAPVRGLMGPFGSGKTNVVIFDAITCASQMPKARDGNRYFRGIVVRDNYTNLWKTMIPSWWQWFPKEAGEWIGGEGRQATSKLVFDMPDGSKLFFEMWFLAIQDQNVQNVLRGIEFTWGNINEADLVTEDVLGFMLGRVLQRRYPGEKLMGPGNLDYFAGITLDFNPPDMDNYLFKLFEEERPEGHVLFKQPSGRSVNGENHQRIPISVYEEIARTNAHRPWFVRAMVDGEWAYSRSGEVVYTDYVDSKHCAADILKPLKGIPLRLGFDQGIRGPAMVVGQYLPTGQLRIIREFCPGRMAPTAFGLQCKIILQTEFMETEIDPHNLDALIDRATCDPAGKQGADKENDFFSWLQIVSEKIGIHIDVAESNEIDVRIDGVAQLLRFDVAPGQPAILISPACKMLRKGFNSHYFYQKRQVGNQTNIDPKPQKNEYADPHDGLQYLVQDLLGLQGVISGALTGSMRGQFGSGDDGHDSGSHQLNSDFDVF